MSSEAESAVVIVAAVDRTPSTPHVLRQALRLAAALPRAELHLLHVIEMPKAVDGLYGSPIADMLSEARIFVDGIRREAAERVRGNVSGHVAVGQPKAEILQLAADLEADLLVVGSHGKGALARMILGSVSEAVVRHAHCAVLVARPTEYDVAPAIEPPCPDCVAVRRESGGAVVWCQRHASHHARAELHYETPEAFGVGSMFIRP